MKNLQFATLIALAAFGLTACDRVTAENYNKLEVGMPYDEVVAILGEPTECSAILSTKSCRWGKEDGKYINANIVGESVILLKAEGLD